MSRLPVGVTNLTTHFPNYGMRRLAASGMLPARAGQPVKAWVHISLADLMILDGSSALMEQWKTQVRAAWAARRAEGSAGGSDGGAWLDGDAAKAMACDAAVAPVVTGDVDLDALEDLVRLCVQLDKHRHGEDAAGTDDAAYVPSITWSQSTGGAGRSS